MRLLRRNLKVMMSFGSLALNLNGQSEATIDDWLFFLIQNVSISYFDVFSKLTGVAHRADQCTLYFNFVRKIWQHCIFFFPKLRYLFEFFLEFVF